MEICGPLKHCFYFHPFAGGGEEDVYMVNKNFKNRLFSHRRRLKDRVIIAYSGSILVMQGD